MNGICYLLSVERVAFRCNHINDTTIPWLSQRSPRLFDESYGPGLGTLSAVRIVRLEYCSHHLRYPFEYQLDSVSY